MEEVPSHRTTWTGIRVILLMGKELGFGVRRKQCQDLPRSSPQQTINTLCNEGRFVIIANDFLLTKVLKEKRRTDNYISTFY